MGGSWVRSRRYWGAISVVLQAAQDRVGVGLPKWGLGYVSLGSLDVDRSSWRCAISPVLGCDEPMLVCDLADARVRRAGAGVRFPWCFKWCELAGAGVRSLFLAVSLSLLFSWGGIDLKVKYKRKWFYRVRGHILRSTEMIFRLTQFSLRTQTPTFTEKHFQK